MYKIQVSVEKASIVRTGEARTLAGLRFAVLNLLTMLNVTYGTTELLDEMQAMLADTDSFEAAVDKDTILNVTYHDETKIGT